LKEWRARAGGLSLLLALFAAVTCAQPLDELLPFPCASNGECPGGLSCAPELGCKRAELDVRCVAGQTDCAPAAANASCIDGLCLESCSNGRPCSAGRACTVNVAQTQAKGACVLDCSAGQACPGGLACRRLGYGGLSGCTSGEIAGVLGDSCTTDFDCDAKDAGALCFKGVCAFPCSEPGDCEPGFACPAGGGACLPDCTDGGACSDGQECVSAWAKGRRLCVGRDQELSACSSVTVLSNWELCIGLCASQYLEQSCNGGGLACPVDAPCQSSGSQCGECEAGMVARRCDTHEACSGDNCPGGTWWCEPSIEKGYSCNEVPGKVYVACNCRDGRHLFSACGTSITCEERCRDECDLAAQDCPTEELPKCVERVLGERGMPANRCVALTGTKQRGQACTRSSAADGTGIDDCDVGLFCSSVTDGPTYQCRKLCAGDGDCAAGEVCPGPDSFSPNVEQSTCRKACTKGSDECGPGQTCPGGFCRAPPAAQYVELGDACIYDDVCKPGLVCNLFRVCAPLCDHTPEHACPPGYYCPNPDRGRIEDCRQNSTM
jgi:hypothetical protein